MNCRGIMNCAKNVFLRMSGAAIFAVASMQCSILAAAAELPLDQVVNGDFEGAISEEGRKAFGWNRFGKCYRVEKNAGENGSTGLVWRNDDPKRYEVPASPIRLVPGDTYEIKARYMTVALNPSGKSEGGIGLCVECKDKNGKFTKGIYQGGYPPTSGKWKGIYQIGTVPTNAVTMTISPTVNPGFTGEVHFDSVSINRVKVEPVLGLHCSAYRDVVESGEFEMVADLKLSSAKMRVEDRRPVLTIPLATGGKKDVAPCEYDGECARFKVDAGELPMGKCKLAFVLHKTNGGKVEDNCRAEREIEKVAKLPQRKVSVDRLNRLMVDGKPFFPIGLFWNDAEITDKKLAFYADSPFNCILNYQQPTKAHMDAYQRHGLKVIYTIEGVYSPGGRFTNEQCITSWTRKAVEAHRNHPALLAWYMNDERGYVYIPQLNRRHRLVRDLDPDHPTYTVLYQLDLIGQFMDAFDVIGTDPYPVGGGDDYRICSLWADASVRESFSIRSVWQVPQVFDWGVYHKNKADTSRQPSVREMKSMFWQAVACGANGLVGYSYFDLKRMDWKTPFDKSWADVCEAANEIKRFFPVILSGDTPPAVFCDSTNARVRSWREKDDVWVLVANAVNKTTRTQVTVDGDWVNAKSGLGPTPVAKGIGIFDVELPPLGVAMWKLVPAKDETAEIQSRIDAASAAGGGKVSISAGEHHVRSLLLKSGVTLHLESGAKLVGSRNPDRYEVDLSAYGCGKSVTRRWSNAIIRIVNAKDVAVTADKGGEICGRNCYDAAGEEGFRGPHAITAFGTTNLFLGGYAVSDAGNFGLYAQGCANIAAKGISVSGGHDGFDFFGCRNVLVEDCRIFSGDDCVAGYNNSNLTVRGCDLNSSCSYFRIGGNGILVENCRGTAPALHPHRWSLSLSEKKRERTPGKAGRRNTLSVFTFFTGKSVKDPADGIVFRNCRFDGMDRLMHYNLSGNERWQNGKGLAEVSFENVDASGLEFPLVAYGTEECGLDLRMYRCRIAFRNDVGELLRGAHVKRIGMESVAVSGAKNLFLNYRKTTPKLKLESLDGVSPAVVATDAKFSCRAL